MQTTQDTAPVPPPMDGSDRVDATSLEQALRMIRNAGAVSVYVRLGPRDTDVNWCTVPKSAAREFVLKRYEDHARCPAVNPVPPVSTSHGDHCWIGA